MKINAGTRVVELIKKYPFLLDFLPEYSPKFQMLRNPVMRATVGRMATLGHASGMVGVGLDELMKAIADAIEKESGDKIEIDTTTDEHATRVDDAALRQEVLKGIIMDLHKGTDVEVIKRRFADLICDIAPDEIARMEQSLVDEGMAPEEVKRLCDVHVQVFKESLQRGDSPDAPPGHPINTFHRENEVFQRVVDDIRAKLDYIGSPADATKYQESKATLKIALDQLARLDKHYHRKEYQLFPMLERHGLSAPPKVMWAIHDEIRALIKSVKAAVESDDVSSVVSEGRKLADMVADMIFKEENILFLMSMETLTTDEWLEVRKGDDSIGYAFITPGDAWPPPELLKSASVVRTADITDEWLKLSTGDLTPELIDLVFTNLPVEVTYVDEHDMVRWYTENKNKAFPRSPGIIGRKVQNCHPHKSIDIVERIIGEFKAGTRDVAEFWLNMGGRFLYIRYFPIRDGEGKYRGIIEVAQDVTGIRALQGERRLLDW